MLNKKDFDQMRKEYDLLDQNRENTIRISRNIIKLSKLIIYSLHRSDVKTAQVYVKSINKELALLKKMQNKNLDTNIRSIAFQEYAEALLFYEFIKNNKIPTAKHLNIDSEHYLLGLCDLSGELMRKAVKLSINKRFKEVEVIRKLVEDIYGEFLKFNLRNSELRKKSDQIKWNLAKLEDLNYNNNNRAN
jgi:translin